MQIAGADVIPEGHRSGHEIGLDRTPRLVRSTWAIVPCANWKLGDWEGNQLRDKIAYVVVTWDISRADSRKMKPQSTYIGKLSVERGTATICNILPVNFVTSVAADFCKNHALAQLKCLLAALL